jgi:hypothetical protein
MLPPAPEQRSGVSARSAEKWARPQSASAAAQLIAHGQRETGPGIQTQGDWTNCGLWPLGAGAGELYAFVAIFGYSRMLGVRFATDKTRSTTLRSIVRCVDDLGGSSAEFLTDRDTALMNGVRSDGSPIYAPEWVDVAAMLGTRPRACRPYRAKTKRTGGTGHPGGQGGLPRLADRPGPARAPTLAWYDAMARRWTTEIVAVVADQRNLPRADHRISPGLSTRIGPP